MRNYLTIIIFLVSKVVLGQDVAKPQELNYNEFIKLVTKNHPVSQQANLVVESGEQNLKSSKGGFDPVVKIDYEQKQFDDKNYFQVNKNEISIPSRIAANFRAGFEQNQGDFLNPQNEMPSTGLVYAGVAVPLGNGLLIDERRKNLRQAQVQLEATEFERQVFLNQLMLDASVAYWQWFQAYETHIITEEAYVLAETRFRGIRQNYLQGNIPAIDTLEAYILVQNREVGKFDAYNMMQKARAELSNYLWSEDQQPLELAPSAVPSKQEAVITDLPMQRGEVELLLENLLINHPELRLYENKIDILDIDRRMKVEKLKPKLNINYNFLSAPVNGEVISNFSTSDYKWGFEFSMPIFLRKERGDLAMTKIKMDQVDLQFQDKALQINNKVNALYVEMITILDQIAIYRRAVTNYLALLEGEKTKFRGGESSIFLVNSRENSLVTAEIKLVELISKFKQSKAKFYQATGNFEPAL
jgi:outer membrane protein TolC